MSKMKSLDFLKANVPDVITYPRVKPDLFLSKEKLTTYKKLINDEKIAELRKANPDIPIPVDTTVPASQRILQRPNIYRERPRKQAGEASKALVGRVRLPGAIIKEGRKKRRGNNYIV